MIYKYSIEGKEEGSGGYEKKESEKADYTSAFGIGTKDYRAGKNGFFRTTGDTFEDRTACDCAVSK